MRSRAIVTHGEGTSRVETLDVGAPGPDEVLVRILASGVCHTDFDSMSWSKPLVMGHEGAGVVEAAGPGVTHVGPGDPVLLNWAISCGRCFQCLRGNHSICESYSPVAGRDPRKGHAHADATWLNGKSIARSFNIGTMSEWTVVRKEAVVRIPFEMPFSSACIMGCGVMTGYGSAVNAAKVVPGSSVAVIGCGGVGLNVIQGARIAGALTIIGIDLSETRLQMARRFGATHTILATREDDALKGAAEAVRALTEGRGADYAFEATANPALGAAPLSMCRNGGMAVQVSGIEQDLTVDMNLFEWDKTYINPLYGKCCPDRDFPRLFGLYKSGALLLDELVTRTYPLDALPQAFDDMRHGRIAKGVIDLSAPS
jgi:S-(hydroxymethyl)glutathione dehydrogenase/alcohol dehydrogenase